MKVNVLKVREYLEAAKDLILALNIELRYPIDISFHKRGKIYAIESSKKKRTRCVFQYPKRIQKFIRKAEGYFWVHAIGGMLSPESDIWDTGYVSFLLIYHTKVTIDTLWKMVLESGPINEFVIRLPFCTLAYSDDQHTGPGIHISIEGSNERVHLAGSCWPKKTEPGVTPCKIWAIINNWKTEDRRTGSITMDASSPYSGTIEDNEKHVFYAIMKIDQRLQYVLKTLPSWGPRDRQLDLAIHNYAKVAGHPDLIIPMEKLFPDRDVIKSKPRKSQTVPIHTPPQNKKTRSTDSTSFPNTYSLYSSSSYTP